MAIVTKILEDPNASIAARQQVDNFYSKEAQDALRAQNQKKEETAADVDMDVGAKEPAQAPGAGAGRLPVQKNVALMTRMRTMWLRRLKSMDALLMVGAVGQELKDWQSKTMKT